MNSATIQREGVLAVLTDLPVRHPGRELEGPQESEHLDAVEVQDRGFDTVVIRLRLRTNFGIGVRS
jgi:hypothetical protein